MAFGGNQENSAATKRISRPGRPATLIGRTMSVAMEDRETRLSMLAVSLIDNGDPDKISEFAGELLAHALAETEGR